MKTEKLVSETSNRSLNISANEVTSLRINESRENTVRVYKDGFIGVEGRLGNADFADMEKAATQKLSQGIAYPETHDEVLQLDIDVEKEIISEKEFVAKIKRLVARLSQENPEFLFSNKIKLCKSALSYENSDGTLLHYKGNEFVCSLVIKHKSSANIMDESYYATSTYYNEEQICHDVKLICDAFLQKLPQLDADEITVIGDIDPIGYAVNQMIADLYFNHASLLEGKLGQKIFNDKLTVMVDRRPENKFNTAFFDAEGVVNQNFHKALVQNGTFQRLLTCKKSAQKYGVENSGSAYAEYTDVPDIGGGLTVESTAKDLANLVEGDAVYISETSGGDMTASGDISLPVMVGYLYRGGKLVGRLPEFAVSVNMFDLLGANFVGVTEKGLFEFGKQKHLVYKVKMVNKSN